MLGRTVGEWAVSPDSCPELAQLVTAINERNVEAYNSGVAALDVARAEQDAERRLGKLVRTLQSVHPQLADLLATSAADQEWDARIRDLPAAWAWSKAQQFVQRWRNAAEERRLANEFDQVEDRIRRVTEEIRYNFTSKSNLYGLLSARSGRDAVVRLREHFRCMPEIINWSSRQFYGEEGLPGLVPLREWTANDLKPLRVEFVEGAVAEGRSQTKRNRIEAKRIVEQLVECLNNPRYAHKTFGVIALQSAAQVKLLDLEIMAATTPEQREDHKIRVGTAPNFQGDERDVIFLSMVVADPPNAQSAQMWQQAYNVAASRAKDQMWLFSSVKRTDLKHNDLRASLMNYMLDPPSVFGPSPSLDSVSATQPCEPFDSLFEQRVFREIKRRGYHAVPQYRVGSRSLDLVVVGAGGRLAVECDGHYWHTSPSQQVSDARRDRELRRMGWDVVRIRESEYEFDPARELAPLWARLAERGIHPRDDEGTSNGRAEWNPVDLSEDEAPSSEQEVLS
jgi:very-short-patch-repair endonuclease